jgi:rubrerythrin
MLDRDEDDLPLKHICPRCDTVFHSSDAKPLCPNCGFDVGSESSGQEDPKEHFEGGFD